MSGFDGAWSHRSQRANRALSRSAREVLNSWPVEKEDVHKILEIASQRGRRSAQWTRTSLTHDRGDLWAIAWLLGPFFLVLPLYAADLTALNFFPFVRSDLMAGLLESIPGALAIILGLVLARWWIRIIRPGWLMYAAAEAGYPICLSCRYWNVEVNEENCCSECSTPLVHPTNLTKTAELSEDLREIVDTWEIDERTRARLARWHHAARKSRSPMDGWLSRRIPKASLLIANGVVLICFGMLLFFGNKLETVVWIPAWLQWLIQGYGAILAVLLLLFFFSGLWLAERAHGHSDRSSLAQAAVKLDLPVCPRCLQWCPQGAKDCLQCSSEEEDPPR